METTQSEYDFQLKSIINDNLKPILQKTINSKIQL